MMNSQLSRRHFLAAAGKSALLLPVAGGIGVVLSACGSSTKAAAPSTSAPSSSSSAKAAPSTISETLETPFGLIPSFLEFYIAKEQGFWAKAGLDVTIHGGTGTASALQSVLGHSTAYARASGIDSIIDVARVHAPVVTVGMAFQRSEFYVTSLADKALKTPKALEGKTIGVVSPNGATQELLEAILKLHGVPVSSVKMPVVGVGGAPYQLAKEGKIDGWVALDTDIATLEQSGAKLAKFNTDEYAYCPADNYIVLKSLIESNPAAISRFLEGIVEAMDFAQKASNFDAVVASAQKINPQITSAELKTQLPILIADWTDGGKEKPVKLYPAHWEKGEKVVEEAGFIPKTVPVDELIDTTFIDKVYGA